MHIRACVTSPTYINIENYLNYESFETILSVGGSLNSFTISEKIERDTNDSVQLFKRASNFCKEIPEEIQPRLTWIRLEEIKIEFSQLVKCLNGCRNLRVLELIGIKIRDESKFDDASISRPRLPLLQSFIFDLKIPGDGKYLKFLDKISFKSAIFFDGQRQSWESQDLLLLRPDIEFIVNGVKIFEKNYQRGQIYSQLKFSDEILENLHGFPLRELYLKDCQIQDPRLGDIVKTLNYSIRGEKEEIDSEIFDFDCDQYTKSIQEFPKNCRRAYYCGACHYSFADLIEIKRVEWIKIRYAHGFDVDPDDEWTRSFFESVGIPGDSQNVVLEKKGGHWVGHVINEFQKLKFESKDQFEKYYSLGLND